MWNAGEGMEVGEGVFVDGGPVGVVFEVLGLIGHVGVRSGEEDGLFSMKLEAEVDCLIKLRGWHATYSCVPLHIIS